ncbi:MAG: glycosyltransferase family 2 protein [Hyphomicrobiales bacterium]|nr:glycosyltransferase family 2 protein [Hyphomicrobiales bacterium]
MSFFDGVTVLILTYNEEANIGRTLNALHPFSNVVVVDSGSTDRTSEILEGYSNVRVVTRSFDSHAAQWNFGLSQCETPWVLALDADYLVHETLIAAISKLTPPPCVGGYRASFRYCVLGHPLSASLYPPGTVLFRRPGAAYLQFGHTQRVHVKGHILPLPGRIDHDDRKPLGNWFRSQASYAKLEAEYLLAKPPEELRRLDMIRLAAWPAPFLVFGYTMFVKKCLFEGWPGWLYVLQRVLAETMLAIELVERRLRELHPS